MIYCDKDFLGKKFKEYRKKRKITQEELSEKIGIAEKHYGKLERGVFSPSLETFFKLVDTLDIPLSEFGIKYNETDVDAKKESIIKEICAMNENELDLYSEIIDSIKKFASRKLHTK